MDKNKRLTVWLPVIIAASIALLGTIIYLSVKEKNGPTPAATR